MNNELYHHGVKGMKWGVRRYQNKDGTRTKRGKVHEIMLERKAARAIKQKKKKEYKKTLKEIAEEREYKDPKYLTDAQIKQKIARIKLEDDYNTVFGKKTIDKGKKQTDSILKKSFNNTKNKMIGKAFDNYGAMTMNAFAKIVDPVVSSWLGVELDDNGKPKGPYSSGGKK